MRSTPAVLVLAALFCVSSCASTPEPYQPPPDHPASPDSPEAAPPPPITAFGAASPQTSGAPGAPAAPAAPAASEGPYVCPMHADVVADAPGKCPKCGMRLEPKTSHAAHAGKKDGGGR